MSFWFWLLVIILTFMIGRAWERAEQKNNEAIYQDGKPIMNPVFNYAIPISDEDAADKTRLDVLWEWYISEDWKPHATN